MLRASTQRFKSSEYFSDLVIFFVNLVIFAEKLVAALVQGVVGSKLHLLQPSSVKSLTSS